MVVLLLVRGVDEVVRQLLALELSFVAKLWVFLASNLCVASGCDAATDSSNAEADGCVDN
jgi:hypothetical protein